MWHTPLSNNDEGHPAFTLVETLVSISILSLLAALTMAGVQKVRAAAARTAYQG